MSGKCAATPESKDLVLGLKPESAMMCETTLGALNGAAFGAITGIVVGLWFGLAGIGAMIALAMLTNLVADALGGILIPQMLARYDVNPAVSPGAFVMTVTDVVAAAIASAAKAVRIVEQRANIAWPVTRALYCPIFSKKTQCF